MIVILCLGLLNLTSLSFKKSKAVTAEGMRAFSSLVNLVKLDLERCSRIHGGLIHLKGLLYSTILDWLNNFCFMVWWSSRISFFWVFAQIVLL